MSEDWTGISADLERILKLCSFVFGMKLYEDRAEWLIALSQADLNVVFCPD